MRAKASSEVTQLQNPPRLLVERDHTRWLGLAKNFLKSKQAASYSDFLNGSIADLEAARAILRNEEDVVRVANLYPMHPLGQAINAKYKTAITQGTEVKQDRCRLDLSFNINQDDEATKQIIMIVEYKRRGFVRTNEFRDASCREGEIKERLSEMNQDRERFSLEQTTNAFWFTKQATAYSVQYGCNYIALCDYESLVLLEIDDFPRSAHMTIVPRHSFRLALLGFMIQACEHVGLT